MIRMTVVFVVVTIARVQTVRAHQMVVLIMIIVMNVMLIFPMTVYRIAWVRGVEMQ